MQVGKIDQIWKDTSAAVTGPCNTLVVIELNVNNIGKYSEGPYIS